MKLIIQMLAMFLFVTPVLAEDANSDAQLTKEAVMANKKLLISTNMGLSEEEKKTFWPVYEEYQDMLVKLNLRTIALIKEYAENFDSMTDEKAGKLLDEFLSIEEDTLALKQKFIPKFEKILSKRKVVRYYQIEEKVKSIINFDLVNKIPLVH